MAVNGYPAPTPSFAQDVRATLRNYGALIPGQVRQIISDAADHIEALQRRVKRLEDQLAAAPGEPKA